MPLLEDFEGHRICARCDVGKKGGDARGKEQDKQAAPSESGEGGSGKVKGQSESEPAQKSQQKPQGGKKLSTSEVSMLVSQKMLSGWTLLHECCPGENCAGVCSFLLLFHYYHYY